MTPSCYQSSRHIHYSGECSNYTEDFEVKLRGCERSAGHYKAMVSHTCRPMSRGEREREICQGIMFLYPGTSAYGSIAKGDAKDYLLLF